MVQSARSAVQNVHCANPNCQKIQYKNVYEIKIHGYTQNYNSLALKTKKLGKRCKVRAVQCKICAVRILIAITPAHQITAL